MLTLKKVKELVEAPSHAKRTPSPKMLFEEGIVLLRREFDQGSHLTVYNSGYVLFSAGKRNTVFHIHDCCGDYAYDAAEGKGDVIKEEYVQNPVYRAKGEIMSLTDKVSQMAKKREQLYADYVAGVVDSEDYQLIREDYSRQYDGLRAALQEAENKKTEVERQIEEYMNMTSHLEEHLDNFEFDIQLVKSLVQKIEVSADKRIRIVFGFQDVFTELGKESAET